MSGYRGLLMQALLLLAVSANLTYVFGEDSKCQLAGGVCTCGLSHIDPGLGGFVDPHPRNLLPNAFTTGQTVLLDFTTGTDGSIVYTPSIRDAITARMTADYAEFGVSFTQTAPAVGSFSTIFFNVGDQGGVAEALDFRNLDKNDNAVVNVTGLAGPTAQDIVDASANIGSHELGHLLGLRHGDSLGPIGSGLAPDGPLASFYLPTYPGPIAATDTVNNLMSSPASVGVDISSGDAWLSERSAIKLAFADQGVVLAEAPGSKDTPATAQPITLEPMTVPNTIQTGLYAGADGFSVDALSVVGTRSGQEDDFYVLEASAGDLLNIEVMSSAITRHLAPFDTTVTLRDSANVVIPYYSDVAFNDDEFESLDSILIDLVIPSDGLYYLQVGAYNATSSGEYELFVHRFNGPVPEPAAAGLALMGLVAIAARRR